MKLIKKRCSPASLLALILFGVCIASRTSLAFTVVNVDFIYSTDPAYSSASGVLSTAGGGAWNRIANGTASASLLQQDGLASGIRVYASAPSVTTSYVLGNPAPAPYTSGFSNRGGRVTVELVDLPAGFTYDVALYFTDNHSSVGILTASGTVAKTLTGTPSKSSMPGVQGTDYLLFTGLSPATLPSGNGFGLAINTTSQSSVASLDTNLAAIQIRQNGGTILPPVKARISSPANGSALSSTSLPLTWSVGTSVSSYYLFVGTVPGGSDIYAGNQGSGLNKTVTVPADKKIHVTLYSLIQGVYQPVYYVFDPVSSTRSTLTSPADGATLSDGTLNLFWTGGVGVSGNYMILGRTLGGRQLGSINFGVSYGASILGMPQDGGPLYVTLYSLINGVYQPENYCFTTASPVSGSRKAALTSPVNRSLVGSAMMDLTWDQGSGVTSYALWVGSAPNGYDIYAGIEGSNLSKSVPIPGDGRRFYVTLHSLISGAYQSNSYWFTAPTLPDGGAAQVTSPAIGSTLTDATLPLTWGSAAGAAQYYIFAGSTPGGYDLYSGSQGTSLARSLTGMPLDGRPIYVTLYSLINGVYKPSSAWFTTANTASGNKRALITSPASGTTLPVASNTFQWGGGIGVTTYALWIGSNPGGYDLWASGESLSATSRTVTLPADGRKIYLTLYSYIGGAWQGASYIYTAANISPMKAGITSPVGGSTFTGASETFTWSTSSSATAYALWIGRYPGGYDIYAGAEGLNTTRTVSTLPTDGCPVYVTIYSLINGAWQSDSFIYNAAPP